MSGCTAFESGNFDDDHNVVVNVDSNLVHQSELNITSSDGKTLSAAAMMDSQ